MSDAVKSRRGLLGFLAVAGAAMALAAVGCAEPSGGTQSIDDPNLPPQPSGPEPPNAIPVRCPW